MRHRGTSPIAVLALLALVLPVVLSAIHLGEHDHGLADRGLEASAFSSIATEHCERDGSTHVEGAELVENERCLTCILKSRSKSGFDRGETAFGTTPRLAHVRSAATDPHDSATARLQASRAPPRA